MLGLCFNSFGLLYLVCLFGFGFVVGGGEWQRKVFSWLVSMALNSCLLVWQQCTLCLCIFRCSFLLFLWSANIGFCLLLVE
jgi:hypothetical protein